MNPFTVLAVLSLQAAGGWSWLEVPEELSAVETRAVVAGEDGALWFGVRDRGLARLADGRLTWFTERDGLVSNGIADLHIDRSGDLWAVGLGGFSVLREGRWERHSELGDLSPRVVFGVTEDPRTGAIWLASSAGAARRVDAGWSTIGPGDGLPHPVVHAVLADREGSVWFACRTGLARRHEGKMEMEILFPDLNVRSVVETPSGVLWFGTSDGVRRWDGPSWTRELEGRTVYPRLVASDGAIWAGSASSGVFRRSDGAWRSVPLPDAYRGAEVFDVAEGGDGSIWIATSAGVARVRRTSASGPDPR